MQKLTEIKKGNEGYGYLIEHDAGHISLDDKLNEESLEILSNIGGGLKMVEPLTVYAVMQKFGIENANKRIYPESVSKKQVEIYMQKVKDKRAYGELNHPESITIDGSRISHNITNLWWEGRTLIGKLDIIMSPGFIKHGIISCEGDRVANYLRLGLKIGVSSRGLGSVEKEKFTGRFIVQDDFEITCWDIVTDPSTNNAWIGNGDVDSISQYTEEKKIFKNKITEGFDDFLNNKNILI